MSRPTRSSELKLYKLARLEIEAIHDELRDKRARAKEIRTILGDKKKLWKVIRGELVEVAERFADKRRTKIGGAGGEDVAFDAEAFIVDEEVTVILSRDGWLKRVREVKDLSATRLREGDAILLAARGGTKESLALFSNLGSCYVLRVNDVPPSTGYGEPVQKLFNSARRRARRRGVMLTAAQAPAGTVAVAASKRGFGLRFNLDPHRELSTRAGRRFAKPAEGDEIVGVFVAEPKDIVTVVTARARALLCRVDELPELANPGRGVILIKVDAEDVVLAFFVGPRTDKEALIAETDGGKKIPVGPGKYSVTGRGGRGHALGRKIKIARVIVPEPPPPPTLLN